ncbi:MAG: hypothetical protein FWC41_03375, partial [Firmicutes bacterium]|nr:hypothetical protein [Bacillota bacterium]
MDFDIYFFGTPYGFDLYPEVFEKATYYQSFYDGSKENSKLTVHRCPNGLVVYSYLRYNLVDYQSRARAFFGISIVFNETYCTDIVNLYELFEGVYNKVILQQGILLKPLNAQTMFAVRTLKEAADEIKRVENIIRKNIINVFANDLYKLDTSFKLNVNENKVCKLNPQEGNNTILQTSREFPMFSLSSEYTTKASNTAVASEQLQVFGNLLYKIKQEIEVLRSESDKLQNQITVRNALQGSEQARKEQEVKLFYRELNDKVGKFFSEISNAQKQIQHFLQNNPEHPQLKGFLNEFNVQKD